MCVCVCVCVCVCPRVPAGPKPALYEWVAKWHQVDPDDVAVAFEKELDAIRRARDGGRALRGPAHQPETDESGEP